MIAQLLLLTHFSALALGFVEFHFNSQINDRVEILKELNVDIDQARIDGSAETIGIVEEIGYARRLEAEVADLRERKADIEAQLQAQP